MSRESWKETGEFQAREVLSFLVGARLKSQFQPQLPDHCSPLSVEELRVFSIVSISIPSDLLCWPFSPGKPAYIICEEFDRVKLS